ncbi:MAG: helix-turn-helix transcriptional regulator [Proteobacteria bacterium]|nr:helix-turn-helix transcriptional regulator [Pseudomonadota bacterium]
MSQLMTTREVAEYLRIKERKVYDLVRLKRIPCTRVTGKLLFPKNLIDEWVGQGTAFPDLKPAVLAPAPAPAPAIVAGSHDPLLDWCLRESGSGLAMMPGGSLDGVRRLVDAEAMLAGMHVFEPETATYNQHTVEEACHGVPGGLDTVLIEWAWRQQGLILTAGNPLAIKQISDLRDKKARVIVRQPDAGSRILFRHLLAQAGMVEEDLDIFDAPARSETDLGLAIVDGKVDAGLAVETVARQYRLDFLGLHRERYDLLIRRRDYFEPPVQRLLQFFATEAFRAKASEMAGYDVSGLGRVIANAA